MALSDNLVAYYKLDETSGTTAYDALGNYNGTNNGATVNQSGKIGKAYSFDGTNDYVQIGDADLFDINNNNFSINLWINPSSWTGTMGIVSKSVDIGSSKGWVLYRDSVSNKLEFRLNDGSMKKATFTSSSISSGSWKMISIVYSDTNGNVILYEDGSYVQTVSISAGDCRTTADITLGFADSWNAYFPGLIDEVGMWNRALSSTEVGELYNSGYGLTYPFNPNATIYPATLALSTTEQTTNIRLNFAGEALQSTLSLKTAIISAINPVYKFGQKELRTSWDELTASDPTKAVGHIQNLVPETSLVPSRYNVGI
jgi:hypothetical protein